MLKFISILFFNIVFFILPTCAFFFDKTKQDKYHSERTKIVDGIYKHYIKTSTARGPVIVNALEVELKHKNISIKVGISDKESIRHNKNTLAQLVKSGMSIAGLNANYFTEDGIPIGVLIQDESWISGPLFNRVAIGFSKDKDVFFEQLSRYGIVSVERGLFKKKPIPLMLQIDCLNAPVNLCDDINIIEHSLAEKLKLPKEKFAYAVKEGCIKSKDARKVHVPEHEYLLVGNKDSDLSKLHRWDCLNIQWITEPDWSFVEQAVSGGPYLLKNGEVFIDEEVENIRFQDKDFYAPRSAIGVDLKGNLFLVAVDGRQAGYSVGFSLIELAKFLQTMGLYTAINLDGGGSTTLVLNGEVLNKPSDGEERSISNAILINYSDSQN